MNNTEALQLFRQAKAEFDQQCANILAILQAPTPTPLVEDRAVETSEAKELLKLKRTAFYLECNSGRLRRLPGRRVRIALSEINRYLAKEKQL